MYASLCFLFVGLLVYTSCMLRVAFLLPSFNIIFLCLSIKKKIERYKARLVAKGYTQTYGVDYLKAFTPVAKMNTVRVLLSLAANFEWNLQQFHVKNAFLQEDLEEKIYMEVPSGFSKNLEGR